MKTAYRLFAAVCALVLLTLPTISCIGTPTADPRAELDEYVYFINVGRGDAILIKSGGGFVLIDTGNKQNSEALVRALTAAGVTAIDALIITHNNSDHAGGIDAVTENFTVKKMYYPSLSEQNKKGQNKLKQLAKKHGLEKDALTGGDSFEVCGITYEVLAPVNLYDEENDNSVVLRAEIGGISYLFTGDMQFAEEADVIASGANLNCDVLKVPNHGNPDAMSEEFAELASPSISIICTSTKVDGNSAARRVLDILAKYGEYHLTEDSETGIIVYHDGNEIKVLHK